MVSRVNRCLVEYTDKKKSFDVHDEALLFTTFRYENVDFGGGASRDGAGAGFGSSNSCCSIIFCVFA